MRGYTFNVSCPLECFISCVGVTDIDYFCKWGLFENCFSYFIGMTLAWAYVSIL